MKKQSFNPILNDNEYIPDVEPRVFGDRVYLYGSHDKFNGFTFCLGDYVCYSSIVNDLKNWKYEGVIFKRKNDPDGKKFPLFLGLGAPDCIKGKDNNYYLYYFCGGNGIISVAKSNSPTGEFKFYGHVKYRDNTILGRKKGDIYQFDPSIFIDDDGKIYLYSGFCPKSFPKILTHGNPFSKSGPIVCELEDDMLTIKNDHVKFLGIPSIFNSKGTNYYGHEFFEASSMRKYQNRYYFIYSSVNNDELCYAVSLFPDKGFSYGGVIISNVDTNLGAKDHLHALNYPGNNHGGMLFLGDKKYIFYHRQTNRTSFSRQVCVEKIDIDQHGKIKQVGITSMGFNGQPLYGDGKYQARIACHLFSKKGTYFYGAIKKRKSCHPYFTENKKYLNFGFTQVIANFCDGAYAGFKEFSFVSLSKIEVSIFGKAKGIIKIKTSIDGESICEIPVFNQHGFASFANVSKNLFGVYSLYFTFYGHGHFDFLEFKLIS